MKVKVSSQAQVQYLGLPGCTEECVNAVAQLIQAGPPIERVRIITALYEPNKDHALLITCSPGDQVIIPSGFSSGYGGEAPHGFSFVLALFESIKIPVDEVHVPDEMFERLSQIALSAEDLESIAKARPVRPSRWYDYISGEDEEAAREGTLWERLEPILPLAVVDARITDLAKKFRIDPDSSLVDAYRRLEDDIREMTGLEESGIKLLAKAFISQSVQWRHL